MGRRDFVRFATGGVAGAAMSGIGSYALGRGSSTGRDDDVRVPGGPEQWKLGVCSLCEGGCGLRVRSVGNRVVKIQGNPLHPVSRGGLCPKGLAGLQVLYHPDRLRSPMRNTGTRRTPRWREISWDDALALLTGKLRELRDGGRAHTVALVDNMSRNLSSRLLQQFLAAYGSPNYLTMPSGLDAFQTAVRIEQGIDQPVAFDLENSRYVLSFGVNLLDGWGSPVAVMRAFGRWRDAAAGRRAKLVQIEPRFSVTAAKADEWLAPRAGSEAALALGIAYVLITEELYDVAFVRERTSGFDRFRSMVMADYHLDGVVSATGVPADRILRVAREFAANRPALAIGDRQTSMLAGDPWASMAVHSLNALVGSIDAPGGVLVQPDLPFSETPPASGSRLVPHIGRLAESIQSGRPYPVNALLLHEADPVFALPNGDQLRRALAETPFIASFSPFFHESAALADVVFPTATDLEKWHAATTPPAFPRTVVSLSPPVIPPRHRTRDAADIFLDVARRLRGDVAKALPFENVEQYLKHAAGEIFAQQRGTVFGTPVDETWDRLLDRSGWWAPSYSTAEELWGQMLATGGWWDAGSAARGADRRFEFYPQTPQAAAAPPAKDELLLLPFEVLPFSRGEGAHIPYLQQIAAANLNSAWDSWLELHPQTARKLGVGDGEAVWVESRRGHARLRVRLFEGAQPGVAHLPVGYGHIEGSEWSRFGINPLRLVEQRSDPIAGLPQIWGTYVRIAKA